MKSTESWWSLFPLPRALKRHSLERPTSTIDAHLNCLPRQRLAGIGEQHPKLKLRQIQVLTGVALDMRPKEIAFDLGVTDKDVQFHLRAGRLSINVFSDIGIYRWAMENHLIL